MRKRTVSAVIALVCVIPFLLMAFESLQSEGNFGLTQYLLLLQNSRFFHAFWNSVLYTAAILAVNLPLSLLAAYGFSRFVFRGREVLFWIYIVMMLMPFQATVVPQYLTLTLLGIADTPWSVVLPNMFATFGTFLMTQYMRSFDRSLYEAAQLDGMNSFTVFWRLVLPVCKPVIAVLTVLSFVNYWSLVEQPSMFLEQASMQPLSIRLNSSDVRASAQAAGVVFCILPLLLYLSSSQALQQGISLTANAGERLTAASFRRSKRPPWRACLTFLSCMLLLTLFAQKASSIMTPQVTVYSIGRPAPVLLEYSTVIPSACLDGSTVYMVQPDPYDGESVQAVSTSVDILEVEGAYTAISAFFPDDTSLVCHRSGEVRSGSPVIVVGEAFYE